MAKTYDELLQLILETKLTRIPSRHILCEESLCENARSSIWEKLGKANDACENFITMLNGDRSLSIADHVALGVTLGGLIYSIKNVAEKCKSRTQELRLVALAKRIMKLKEEIEDITRQSKKGQISKEDAAKQLESRTKTLQSLLKTLDSLGYEIEEN